MTITSRNDRIRRLGRQPHLLDAPLSHDATTCESRGVTGGTLSHPTARLARDGMQRRGISLLEVLLSMFILTVGMLGVAALIPVGRYDLKHASQADRTSAVGRAVYRDVQVRGMLEPEMWLSPAYDASVPENPWFDVDEIPYANMDVNNLILHPLVFGNSLCIDPLFVAKEQDALGGPLAQNWTGRAFPYPLDNDPAGGAVAVPRMARGTLKAWNDHNRAPRAWPLGLLAAERIFRWQDDLVFDPVAHDLDGRPAQVFDVTSSAQYLGDYSWLVTLAPELDANSVTNPNYVPQNYTASVVVFYRRVLDRAPLAIDERAGTLPTERTVYAEFPFGPGMGTVDVVLRLSAAAGNPLDGSAEQSDFPAVKAGQWIMLCGWTRNDGSTPSLHADNRMWATFRWYRVASVGELLPVADNPYGDQEDEWQQNVTLAGPPMWDAAMNFGLTYFDADDNGGPTLHAVIVDGVVGVYEKTVRLSR